MQFTVNGGLCMHGLLHAKRMAGSRQQRCCAALALEACVRVRVRVLVCVLVPQCIGAVHTATVGLVAGWQEAYL